jgi:hypothetical protein
MVLGGGGGGGVDGNDLGSSPVGGSNPGTRNICRICAVRRLAAVGLKVLGKHSDHRTGNAICFAQLAMIRRD